MALGLVSPDEFVSQSVTVEGKPGIQVRYPEGHGVDVLKQSCHGPEDSRFGVVWPLAMTWLQISVFNCREAAHLAGLDSRVTAARHVDAPPVLLPGSLRWSTVGFVRIDWAEIRYRLNPLNLWVDYFGCWWLALADAG